MIKFVRVNQKLTMSLIAAGLLVSTVACSSGDGGTTSQGPAGASSSSSPKASDTKPKPELKVLHPWQKEDYSTYPVAKLLEEGTGYKVKYDMLPQDKPMEKLNLIIASGESYDEVTVTGGSDVLSMYADYARKGALLEISSLIDQYGPNIKKAISQGSLDAMKVDGKLYGIPFKGVDFTASTLLIREDWLAKLNLKMPETVDEFINVLKQFKEKDPGGNGDKNIPMTMPNIPFADNLVGAFGMAGEWNDVGGKLTPRVLDPAYTEYISLMTELYKEGLVDREFPINKSATATEKFASGKAGVVPMPWYNLPGAMEALSKNNPSAKAVYMPAMKGKDGKFGLYASAGFDRITFIPKTAKNPEDIIKWIDAKLEPELFKRMAIGEEGKHYTYKDGGYTPILPIFNDERNQAINYITGVDEKNYPTYWQARVRKDPNLFVGWEFLNLKQPPEVKKSNPLGFAPYLPEYSSNNQKLNSLINDYTTKLIAGAESLDGLETFRKKYLAEGGEASHKEVNEWYAKTTK
jgi:putative aldouronate transport system substrate-binding protein